MQSRRRTKKLDGIEYALAETGTFVTTTSYDVLADNLQTQLRAVRTPGRWVLLGKGSRREFGSLGSLFERIAREVHG